MKKIFRLKYLAHHFVNNIFYIIVFLLGFFLGMCGKKIIPQVLALEQSFNIPSFNYSEYDFKYYEDNDLFKKIDLLIERFYKLYDKEEYGITVVITMNFTNSNKTTIYNNVYSNINIFAYKKSALIDYSDTTTQGQNYVKLMTSMGIITDSYGRYNAGVINAIANGPNIFKYSSLTYSPTSILWNGSLEDVSKSINNGTYDTYLTLGQNNSTTTVNIEMIPRENTSWSSSDIIYYYSDVKIKSFYSTNSPRSYKFGDVILDEGDYIPFYKNWIDDNKKPSLIDDLYYVCTDKPFFLTSKQGTQSATAVNDTYTSSIYLDYDLPFNLYPYLFYFVKHYTTNGTEVKIPFIYYDIFNKLGNFSVAGTDGLIGVPFTIDNINRIVFGGYSQTWKVPYYNEEHTLVDYSRLEDLSNWDIDITDKYFYDYMVYLGNYSGTYYQYKTDYISKLEIIKLLSTSLDSKRAYIHYLLMIRNNYDIYNSFCFYYDNENLTFSYGTFNDMVLLMAQLL